MAKGLQVYIEYLNKGLATVQTGLGSVDQGLRKIGKTADMLDAKLRRVDQTLAGWQRTTALIAGAGIGGLGLLAKEGLKVHGMFERINLSLEVMLGNKKEADQLMKDVVQFAATTPFGLLDLSKAVTQMKSFRVETENVIPYLRIIGEAAATMSVPIEQAMRAMLMLRGGLFETQQLVPIGINRELLKQYGVQFAASGQLVSSGEEAFQAALKAMEDQYGGLFERVNLTIEGMLNNLGDNITRLLDKVGERMAGKFKQIVSHINEQLLRVLDSDRLMGGINRMIDVLIEELEPHIERLTQWFDKLIYYLEQNPQALVDGMRTFVGVLKDLVAVVLALTAARGILALIMAFTSIASLLGGGIGGLIGVVAGGAGLIWLFNQFRSILDGATKSVGTLTGALPGLNTQLGDTGTKAGEAKSTTGGLFDLLAAAPARLQPTLDFLGALKDQLDKIAQVRFGEDSFMQWLDNFSQGDFVQSLPFQELFNEPPYGLLGLSGIAAGDKLSTDKGLMSFREMLDTSALDLAKVGDTSVTPLNFHTLLGQQIYDQQIADRERAERDAQTLQAAEDQRGELGITSGMGGLRRAEDVQKLTLRTQELIKGLPANKICVIKTRDGFWLMSGDDPDAKPLYDAFTASVQTSIPSLEQQGMHRTAQPVAGDIVFLDRMAGPNTPAGGHAGIFYGYNEQGQPIVSGNRAGSLYNIEPKWGKDFSLETYTNQQGLFAFANPFSFVRSGTSYGAEFRSPLDELYTPGGEDIARQYAALGEEDINAIEAKIKATQEIAKKLREQEEQYARIAGYLSEQQREAEKQKLEQQKVTLGMTMIANGLDGMLGLLDQGAFDELMGAVMRAAAAGNELAAQLEAEALAVAQEQAGDARRQAQIALARMRGATAEAGWLKGVGLLDDAKQAMDDLANAADAPETELYQLRAAAYAAVMALGAFAASLNAMESTIAAQQAAILEQYASTYMAMIEALQGGPLTGPQSDRFAGMFGDQSGRTPGGGSGFYSPRTSDQPYDQMTGDYFY